MVKKNLRVLHTSDIHLGEGGPSYITGQEKDAVGDFESVVNLALSNEVDLVIIAGDFFDNNRIQNDLIEQVSLQIERLTMPMVILPGNHDCLVSESVYHRVDFTAVSPKVYVMKNTDGESVLFPGLDLNLWGRPLAEYGGNIKPIEGVPPRGSERWNIVIAHGHYMNGNSRIRYSFPITEKDIIETQRDYVALGHWANFNCITKSPVTAIYCGSPSLTNSAVIVDFHRDSGEIKTTNCPFNNSITLI